MTIASPDNAIRTYGLIIEQARWAECDAVLAKLVVREGTARFPCNPRADGESTTWDAPARMHGLLLNDLRLRAYVSANGGSQFTHLSIEYENLHGVSLKTAEQAARTLRLIDRQIEKDRSSEAGDLLMSIGKALRLSFFVSPAPDSDGRRPPPSGRLYSDCSWRFAPLSEARDELRARIAAIEKRAAA